MLSLKNLTLRRGAKTILDAAQLTLHTGERVGLIGRNGVGKSTLFALLRRELHEDGGDWHMPPDWRTAHVAQELPQTDLNATDYVVAGDVRLAAAQTALAQLETITHPTDAEGEALALAQMDFADAGGYDASARAQQLILGLGFKLNELERPVHSFSGGWQMRLQLARALMCPSDLLLLDEPTNHLDLDALVWLEDWLRAYRGVCLIISHDKAFLDATTQAIIYLDNQRLTRYSGNYAAFEVLYSQQLELNAAAVQKQGEQRAHLEKFIARFKAKASKAKQAQSRVKALERMETIAPMLQAADFNFSFKVPAAMPNPMLTSRALGMGYAAATPILQGVNVSILPEQRIGILGANGQGKSTLVKTLVGELAVLAGDLSPSKHLTVGYFAQQELDVLDADSTPLEQMNRFAKTLAQDPARSRSEFTEQAVRNQLGQFRFTGDMVHQRIETLSGGEKARLMLSMIVWQRPNVLIFDEPTNHLDINTREALSVALNDFEGAVLLVSHDRALLTEVCDEFWLVGDGQVKPFAGDMDDYLAYLRERSKAHAAALKMQLAKKPAGVSSASEDAVKSQLAQSAHAAHSHEAAPFDQVENSAALKLTKAAQTMPAVASLSMPSAPQVLSREDRMRLHAEKQARDKLLKAEMKRQERLEAAMNALQTKQGEITAQQAQPLADYAQLGKALAQTSAELEAAEAEWLACAERVQALEAEAAAAPSLVGLG